MFRQTKKQIGFKKEVEYGKNDPNGNLFSVSHWMFTTSLL